MESLDFLNKWTGHLRFSQAFGHSPGDKLTRLGKGWHVFSPGVYDTTGIQIDDYCALVCPDGWATIRLRPGNPWPHKNIAYALGNPGTMMLFYLRGIRFILGWEDWKDHIESVGGNFKLGAFALRCWQGKAENFEVYAYGASGKGADGTYNEVFPARLDTYTGPGEREMPPQVEMSHGLILGGRFEQGGYATCAFTQSSQPGGGDRLDLGVRNTVSAEIHDMTINDRNAIALGCGRSDNVVFRKNTVLAAKCAFNFDTGDVDRLSITDNVCRNVTQGVNLSGGVKRSRVRHNIFLMTPEPYYNQEIGMHEPQWDFQQKPSDDLDISDNTVVWSKDEQKTDSQLSAKLVEVQVAAKAMEENFKSQIQLLRSQKIVAETKVRNAITALKS